jgi:hypothetical protein
VTPEHADELTASEDQTAATSAGLLDALPAPATSVPEHIRRALDDVDPPARRALRALRIVGTVVLIALLIAGFGMVAGLVPSLGGLIP